MLLHFSKPLLHFGVGIKPVFQLLPNGFVQPGHLSIGQGVGAVFRMNTSLKQDLIDNPVTQARHYTLIEKNRFDKRFFSPNPLGKLSRDYVEAIFTNFLSLQKRIDINMIAQSRDAVQDAGQ